MCFVVVKQRLNIAIIAINKSTNVQVKYKTHIYIKKLMNFNEYFEALLMIFQNGSNYCKKKHTRKS